MLLLEPPGTMRPPNTIPLHPHTPRQPRITSPFLHLPPELRNDIYYFALIEPSPIPLTYDIGLGLDGEPDVPIRRAGAATPGIINACRQTRNESLAIYYRENSFRISCTSFSSHWPFRRWWARRERAARRHMRHLQLQFEVHRSHRFRETPFGCTINLQIQETEQLIVGLKGEAAETLCLCELRKSLEGAAQYWVGIEGHGRGMLAEVVDDLQRERGGEMRYQCRGYGNVCKRCGNKQ